MVDPLYHEERVRVYRGGPGNTFGPEYLTDAGRAVLGRFASFFRGERPAYLMGWEGTVMAKWLVPTTGGKPFPGDVLVDVLVGMDWLRDQGYGCRLETLPRRGRGKRTTLLFVVVSVQPDAG